MDSVRRIRSCSEDARSRNKGHSKLITELRNTAEGLRAGRSWNTRADKENEIEWGMNFLAFSWSLSSRGASRPYVVRNCQKCPPITCRTARAAALFPRSCDWCCQAAVPLRASFPAPQKTSASIYISDIFSGFRAVQSYSRLHLDS